MTVKTAKLAFGASLLAIAAQISSVQAADPAEAPINGDSTAILRGKPAETTDPGKASFTIDIGALGFGEKVHLRLSDKTATIFVGSDKDANRVCPFFNLNARQYEIEEIQKDVYKITADVTPEDVKKVMQSGCIVTTRPDLKKIKYLKN